MKNLLLMMVIWAGVTTTARAQDFMPAAPMPADTSTATQTNGPTLGVECYTDVYYAAFTHDLGPNELQPWTTVAPRSDRFGLNTAQVTAAYAADHLRANLTLHYGDIAEATWAPAFRPVQQANVGFRVAEGWWVDGGFFTTHIGTESFLPKNNYLSSTAVATYNEPFYQAGARLSYESSHKVAAQLWVLNGYNFFLDANDHKTLGLLLSYAPSDHFSVTYTNLAGREDLPETGRRQLRTYHNLYFNLQPAQRFSLIIGGDFGTQSNSDLKAINEAATMYNALITARYDLARDWSVTARAERFSDPSGFISGVYPTDELGAAHGLELTGYTLGLEYRPVEDTYLRLESRRLELDEELNLFNDDGSPGRERWEVLLTAGVLLDWNFTLR